jgi:hypothetical protein
MLAIGARPGAKKQLNKKPSHIMARAALLEERATGLEPVTAAWKAAVLPLHHARDTTSHCTADEDQGLGKRSDK